MTHTEKRWARYFDTRKAIQQERWKAHHAIDAEADAKINELARSFFAQEDREMVGMMDRRAA